MLVSLTQICNNEELCLINISRGVLDYAIIIITVDRHNLLKRIDRPPERAPFSAGVVVQRRFIHCHSGRVA